MTTLVVLALVVAVAAAIRSTWSPCGLSMLSAMNPLSERGRGRSFRVSASWFVVGATAGGVTLGAGAGLLALGLALLDVPTGVALAIGAVAALVAVASDVRLGGFHVPYHTRQVNEDWLDWYRAWVYGVGFGWQIGVGLATYIMTAALYLMILLAALTLDPLVALGCGALFGLVRGLAVLLARPLTTPAAIVALHERLDRWEAPVRVGVVGVEVVAAAGCAAAVAGLWAGVAAAVVGAAFAVVGLRRASVSQRLDPAA
jgi:hypothetical protein